MRPPCFSSIPIVAQAILVLGFLSVSIAPSAKAAALANNNAEITSVVLIQPDCEEANGEIRVSLLRDVSNYTFQWQPNLGTGTENIKTDLVSGTYSLTITDINDPSCVITRNFYLNNTDGPEALIAFSLPATCQQSNGRVVLSPLNLNYQWCDGVFGNFRSDLPAGRCDVTVTDLMNGCLSYLEVVVPEGSPLIVSSQIRQQPTCNLADGELAWIVSGSSGNLTYEWSDGGMGRDRNDLAAGIYTVTVTDNVNGCIATGSASLTNDVAAANTFNNISFQRISCPGEEDGGINFDVVFDPGFAFPADTSLLDADGLPAINGQLSPGNYELQISDANGCITAAARLEFTDPEPLDLNVIVTDIDCNRQGSIVVEVSGGSGNYTFDWGDLPGADDPQDRLDLAEDTYELTVTDDQGCSVSINNIVLNDICIPGCQANAGTIRTNDPTLVCLSDGIDDILRMRVSGNNGSNYAYMVTSQAGTISQFNANELRIVGLPSTCLVYGIAFEQPVFNLSIGANIADLTGCFDLSEPIVVEKVTGADCPPPCDPPVIANQSVLSSSCDSTNGQIILQTVADPAIYNYQWDPAVSTNNTANNLATGVYYLTISDPANSACNLIDSIAVGNVDGPVVEIVSTTPASCEQSNGTAVLSPAGFQYNWCNGSVGFNGLNLPAGSCFVTVTDPGSGCSTIVEVPIEAVQPLEVEVIIDAPADCGQANGMASVIATNGSSNYTYAWSNRMITSSISGLAAGVYDVTVSDRGITRCSEVVTFVVLENVPTAEFTADPLIFTSCPGEEDATAVLSTITFSPGFVQPSRTEIMNEGGGIFANGSLGPGSYCALVYDNNNCLAGEACFEVADAPALEAYLNVLAVSCDSLGEISVVASGGDGSYSYSWGDLPAPITDPLRDDLATGQYNLTITDGQGCTAAINNISIIDGCSPCPEPDTMNVAVLANESRLVCVPTEFCYDRPSSFFTLTTGGLIGSSPLGDWVLESDGCVRYNANDIVGMGGDTVYVVAGFNGLRDTTCIFFTIVDGPGFDPGPDTLFITTQEETQIDSCLSTLALTGPLASADVLQSTTGGTFTIRAQDSCFSYLPSPGTTGNFIDTALVVLCDVNDICDTFQLIFTVVPNGCPDFLTIDQDSAISFDCSVLTTYCLDIPLVDIFDYRLIIDGQLYNDIFNGCNIVTITRYDMQEFLSQFPSGPYQLDSWTVDGQVFSIDSFNDLEELVDSMQVWDPAGNWMYDGTRIITGGAPGSMYGPLIGRQVGGLLQVRVDLVPQDIAQGTEINVPVGEYDLVINELATACQDTLSLTVECRSCPPSYTGPDQLTAMDCDGQAALCLEIGPAELPNFEFFDNGAIYTGVFNPCLFDTTFLYDVSSLTSNMYRLVWVVGNDTLRLANFSSVQELFQEMVNFDPAGNWQLVGQLIVGGAAGTNYGPLQVSQNGIPLPDIVATLQTTATNIALQLDTGFHEVIIQDTITGCADTLNLQIDCPTMEMPDTSLIVLEGATDTFCIDLSALDTLTSIQNICPGQSDGDVSLDFLSEAGCLAFGGLGFASDTFCIEICDSTLAICDTVQIAVAVQPQIDTLPLMIKLGFSDTLCLNTSAFRQPLDTIFNICPNASGQEVLFDLIAADYCVGYEALALGTDTACIVICDVMGICDTTIVTVNVMPPVPDTSRLNVLVGTTEVFCMDTSELSGVVDTLYNICPGSSGVFVDFTVAGDSICVRYTGLDMGVDTACLVFCDDLICDTTYLFVEGIRGSLDPPVAVDDDTMTIKNIPVNIRVLLNDTLNGSSPAVFILRPPTAGNAVINPDFTITYLSDPEFCGQRDSFEYILQTSTGADTAEVSIFIQCEDLTIYSGFSPNGDGTNDTFQIPGIENFPNNKVCIFNRWGNQVFCTDGYTNLTAWDGTWNGKDLPDGTYFYLIDDGAGRKLSGYVQLNR
ncbi:MAG: gliding motility-associated C-terminal domain-containing protein [Bacteroidota bacterium]